MEILQLLLPSSSLLHLDQYDLDRDSHHLILHASSTQTAAHCPLCGGITHRIHSHYERTLADLPCVDCNLTLLVHVSKFFCVNPQCRRHIFTERFPDVAAPWARKTARLVHRMQPTATMKAEQQAQNTHQQRIEHQKMIKALHEQGWSQAVIAQKVDLSIRTVQRYLSQPDFPDALPRRSTFGKGILDPYKPQLLDWWNSGIRQPHALMALLQQNGFTGSERTLQRYIKGLRTAQGLPPVRIKPVTPLPQVIDPQRPRLTPRRVAYLMVLRPENRDPEDRKLLQCLAEHPALAGVVTLADQFLDLIRQHQARGLDDWLKQAITSAFKPFQSFASGLFEDYDAVKASLTTAVSNGPVEGLNNRLKMLKRQMYGRAGLDLLAKRFIMAV